MERSAINPTQWSLKLGFNQGEVVTSPSRTLYISGQTAMNTDGQPEHMGDIGAQFGLAIDNLAEVLRAADMSWANLIQLRIYTTDIDALFPHYGQLTSKLVAAGVSPTTTMVQVVSLAIGGQLVEVEGIAVG